MVSSSPAALQGSLSKARRGRWSCNGLPRSTGRDRRHFSPILTTLEESSRARV